MKIVFMGTPDFAVRTLERIHEENHEIELVVTMPDRPKGRGKKMTPPPVKVKAQELGIDVFQPQKINNEVSIAKLKEISPDVIVVVAYGQILKEEILTLPKYGCINVHASLLPKYRGAAPINWVIIKGEKMTGITTMHMEKGLDTGDMLLKKETPIGENETAGELHDRLMEIGANLLVETLTGLEQDSIIKIPQDHRLSSYAPIMDKNLGRIDWNKSATEIKNLVRGTEPWPSAFTKYKNDKIKIFNVEVLKKFEEGQPGQVVKVSNEGIFVNSFDDCLLVKEIQFPGKKRMKVENYLKGNTFECGVILS